MPFPTLVTTLCALALVTCGAPSKPERGGPSEASSEGGEQRPGQRRAEDAEQPPRTLELVGEVTDGTILDVVGSPEGPWIASGRNVRRLDPLTGEPVELHPASPFEHTVMALERTKDGRMLVATAYDVHVFGAEGVQRTFHAGELGAIADFRTIGDTGRIAVLVGGELVVLEPLGESGMRIAGRSGPTRVLLSLERLSLLEHDGEWTAYVVGAPANARRRGVRGLAVAELGRDGKTPRFLGKGWDPTVQFDDPAAATRAVRVVVQDGKRVAYVASGVKGQLARLDVSDATDLRVLDRIELHEGQEVNNISHDEERGLFYVASANRLHVLDVKTGRRLGEVQVGFQNGGERGMGLCVLPDGRRVLWTGVRHQVDFVLNGIDVTNPEAPEKLASGWWISSSDGAVAIAEWSSVYLPTWGGVARYDISDPTQPVARGYAPVVGSGATEHIDWAWVEEGSTDEAWLVTAAGNGPVMLWPLSKDEPDPRRPRRFDFVPPSMEGAPSYQNDAVFYRRNGELYVLSDLSDRRRRRVALRALQVSTGKWVYAAEESGELLSNAQQITVSGDLAFVTVLGGFFVVRLDRLPERLDVVAEHSIEAKAGNFRASGLALTADRKTLFVGSDVPGRVLSFRYDPQRHRLSEPIGVLESDTGVIARFRFDEEAGRIYCAARGGRVLELDVTNPRELRFLGGWQAPGYDGPMQDVRLFEFGGETMVLAVKNNEGFALLRVVEQ